MNFLIHSIVLLICFTLLFSMQFFMGFCFCHGTGYPWLSSMPHLTLFRYNFVNTPRVPCEKCQWRCGWEYPRSISSHKDLVDSFSLHIYWCMTDFLLGDHDSKVYVANMEPTWGRQDPGGPHVGPHGPCYLGIWKHVTCDKCISI